jgi:hypothetical protein
MKIECSLTFANYKDAIRLHYRQGFYRRIIYFVQTVVAPGIAVLPLGYLIVQSLLNREFAESISPFTWLFFLLLCCFPLLRTWSLRKQFRNMFPKSVSGEGITYEINDECIVSAFPGVNEGKYYWNSILRFVKDEKIALFYLNKNRFLFPTSALSAPEQAELDALVARHGIERQK